MSRPIPHNLRGEAWATQSAPLQWHTSTCALICLLRYRLHHDYSPPCPPGARATNFHISFLVGSCHCVWNYMRQSYGLTYYSLHYTRNRLLVTSQPISQNMLMTANYYTIRLQYCEGFRVSPSTCSRTSSCIYVIMEGVFVVCVCVCVSVCLSVCGSHKVVNKLGAWKFGGNFSWIMGCSRSNIMKLLHEKRREQGYPTAWSFFRVHYGCHGYRDRCAAKQNK